MLTAVDTTTGRAVTSRGPVELGHRTQSFDETVYRCLACGESLRYCPEATAGVLGTFMHSDGGCHPAENVSDEHRATQELVAATLFNWLPTTSIDQIGIERRIGTASDFLIGDVVVGDPIQLVVEVVYEGSLELQRRLSLMRRNNYVGSVVVVTSGRHSAARLDSYLQRLGGGRVGRCNPATCDVRLGDVLVPEEIKFNSPAAKSLPAYIT